VPLAVIVHPSSYAGNRGSFNVHGPLGCLEILLLGRADTGSTQYLADATDIIAMTAAQCVPGLMCALKN
jgi:hypothetical protein